MTRAIALAVGLAALGGAARAAEVKIENYGNGSVYVAQADNRGQTVSHGWLEIKSNGTRTITAPDNVELYLRVQDAGGKEITFTKHQTFLNFPGRSDRFSVKTEPDDPKVWVLKHGKDLELSRNMNKGAKFPEGWHSLRFFKIGSGSHKLEVKP